MKIIIAKMMHETNTYSPVRTPLSRFAISGDVPPEGLTAYELHKNTGSAIGAFIEHAEAVGAKVVIPIAAYACPSGPVEDEAFEYMANRICEAVEQGCDAVLLDLHGAMVTQTYEDGEGELLARLRVINKDVPIGVSLDMHANLYPAVAQHATVVAGYQTYPHVDMYETGRRVSRAIFGRLCADFRPTMAWGNRPMLPHVMRQGSNYSPNLELQARCREIEALGALCASVFMGFPNSDIHNAGLSALVVTDNNEALARKWCEQLLEMAWQTRADFIYTPESLAVSMDRAHALSETWKPGDGPVILLDHCDNCSSGGTMDTMTVLSAILDAELEGVAVFAIFDPDAVSQMAEAGVGAEVCIQLGGKLDMPAIGITGQPRKVTGRVRLLHNGRYQNLGPMARGELHNMGQTAVLDTGRVEIVVISNQEEPYDLAPFQELGIDLTAKRYLMLKSRVHWRAGLGHLASEVVECAGTGVCSSDYGLLDFKKVRRPIYPIDPM